MGGTWREGNGQEYYSKKMVGGSEFSRKLVFRGDLVYCCVPKMLQIISITNIIFVVTINFAAAGIEWSAKTTKYQIVDPTKPEALMEENGPRSNIAGIPSLQTGAMICAIYNKSW